MASIGLLGGCFNPVHNGHLRLAVEAKELLGLDGVELVPAAVPPHKSVEGMLGFDLRAAMVEAAISGAAGLQVNRMEAERAGPSYTIETLERLRVDRPADAWTFILGVGDLLTLPQWERGLDIPCLARLAVARREDGDARRVGGFIQDTWPGARQTGQTGWALPGGGEIVFLDIPRLDLSASDIRRRWLAGFCVRGLMPGAALALLEANREDAACCWDAQATGAAPRAH